MWVWVVWGGVGTRALASPSFVPPTRSTRPSPAAGGLSKNGVRIQTRNFVCGFSEINAIPSKLIQNAGL